MDTPKEIGKGIERLIGTSWWSIVQMLYLMGKYQENCIFLPITFEPILEEDYKRFTNKPFGGFVSLNWDCKKECVLRGPVVLNGDLDTYKELLKECVGGSQRLTVVPIELYSKTGGHANILVYDKIDGSLERFEPNGAYTPEEFQPKKLDSTLKRFFTELFEKEINYVPPIDFCPRYGAQIVEMASRRELGVSMKKGLCSVWSFIYANYRLKYPDKSPKVIASYLAKKAEIESKRSPEAKGKTLYHFAVEIIRMLAFLSQKLRKAKTIEEIEEVLIRSTKMIGGF